MSVLDLPLELQCLVVEYLPDQYFLPIALFSDHWSTIIMTYFHSRLQYNLVASTWSSPILEQLCLKFNVSIEAVYTQQYPIWQENKHYIQTLRQWAGLEDEILRNGIIDQLKNPGHVLVHYFVMYNHTSRQTSPALEFALGSGHHFKQHLDAHTTFVDRLIARIPPPKLRHALEFALYNVTRFTPPPLYLILQRAYGCKTLPSVIDETTKKDETFPGYRKAYKELFL